LRRKRGCRKQDVRFDARFHCATNSLAFSDP
jgi:hypothetical protein